MNATAATGSQPSENSSEAATIQAPPVASLSAAVPKDREENPADAREKAILERMAKGLTPEQAIESVRWQEKYETTAALSKQPTKSL